MTLMSGINRQTSSRGRELIEAGGLHSLKGKKKVENGEKLRMMK
jgi:hypothetical protein